MYASDNSIIDCGNSGVVSVVLRTPGDEIGIL